MARTFTLAQLRTKARERADMVGSLFVTDSELSGYVSASYCELYEMLVKSGQHFFESTQAIATTGTGTYALPSDYFGTLGVDYQSSSTTYTALYPLMVQERNNFQPTTGSQAMAYRIVGSNIILYPTPPTGQAYRHLYVPCPSDLTSDAQTVDGVSGWEEFIVIDAAIKCLAKEESPTGHLERERERIKARIEEAAEIRAIASPMRVVDVQTAPMDAADWPE